MIMLKARIVHEHDFGREFPKFAYVLLRMSLHLFISVVES
jgi:hypothetical protein